MSTARKWFLGIAGAIVIALVTSSFSFAWKAHADIVELQAETRSTPEILRDIDQRLSRIEGALGVH